MIVAEASYEVSDPTIDSQVLKIKDAGADLFFSASTPKQAAQAIKKIAELGWHPVQIVDINATSVGAVLKPAGLEASKGLISTNYGKDPGDPQWKDDPGMKHYFDFMAKYYPRWRQELELQHLWLFDRANDGACAQAVRRRPHPRERDEAGHQPEERRTRPGAARHEGNTTPNDYRVNKQMQMMKFNGERWELFGPILEDTGAAG